MADDDKHSSTEQIRPRFPKLASLTEDILYSNAVWKDPALNPRDRSLITLSALVVLESPQLETHLKRALNNKVKPGRGSIPWHSGPGNQRNLRLSCYA